MKKHLQKILFPVILLSSPFCFIDAQEILFQDAVESDGTWTNVWGGFYPTMDEETGKFNSLGPIEGETYWTATTVNVAARGLRHTLIEEMIKPGTYHLEFWVGVTGAQWFANRQGPVSGISSDADFAINPNDFSTLLQNLDDSIILAKRFVPPPMKHCLMQDGKSGLLLLSCLRELRWWTRNWAFWLFFLQGLWTLLSRLVRLWTL